MLRVRPELVQPVVRQRQFTTRAATLDVVTQKANELGAGRWSDSGLTGRSRGFYLGDGAIALHNAAGVPLRSLGTGSSHLLVAGMQRAAAQRASVALVDEVEYGLEPHRLTRLLNSLGPGKHRRHFRFF